MNSDGQNLWRNVQDLLSDGTTPYERRFEEHFSGPIIPIGANAEDHPISAKDQARLHQFGMNVLSGIFDGLRCGGSWKGDLLVGERRIRSENGEAKVLVLKEGDDFRFSFAGGSSWQEKVLKSDHPTEIGKTSKKEKNTAVIFKEKRTKLILQINNENKMKWEQSVISGAYLEASFFVIMFKKDKN